MPEPKLALTGWRRISLGEGAGRRPTVQGRRCTKESESGFQCSNIPCGQIQRYRFA